MLKLILLIVAGAAGGGLLGSTRSCETGGCPLTATPLRGAMYGGCMAALLGLAVFGVPSRTGRDAAAAATSSEFVVHVAGEEEFAAAVLQSGKPVLVDFYADWCGPCRRLSPLLNELADELAGKAVVVKVNVDQNKGLATEYGVSSIPDVRVFRDGKQTGSSIGARDKAFYLDLLGPL